MSAEDNLFPLTPLRRASVLLGLLIKAFNIAWCCAALAVAAYAIHRGWTW